MEGRGLGRSLTSMWGSFLVSGLCSQFNCSWRPWRQKKDSLLSEIPECFRESWRHGIKVQWVPLKSQRALFLICTARFWVNTIYYPPQYILIKTSPIYSCNISWVIEKLRLKLIRKEWQGQIWPQTHDYSRKRRMGSWCCNMFESQRFTDCLGLWLIIWTLLEKNYSHHLP
jgi:hypothetical protein